MISLIIFDLSEVILNGLYGTEIIIAKQLNINRKEIAKEIGINGAQPELINKLYLGEISEDQYIEKVLRNTGWPISPKKLKKLIRDNMQPVPGMLELLKRINPNIQRALITNHAKEWLDYCKEQYDLSQYFGENIFGSYDIKELKPNPNAIRFVLNELRKNPKDVLYIDDLENNIECARKLGLDTHLFTSVDKIESDLINRELIVM